MAFLDRQTLVQNTISTLGLVAGTSVQLYTEPIIERELQHVFDMLFRKQDWRHLSQWITATIDPTTGRFTADQSAFIKEWQHIITILESGTEREITLPVANEHLLATGSKALYYNPLPFGHANADTHVIQFYPTTAAHNVDIYVKVKPADFSDANKVPFPPDIMEYGTAWSVLEASGNNPSGAGRARTLFDVAYDDYTGETSARKFKATGNYRRNLVIKS